MVNNEICPALITCLKQNSFTQVDQKLIDQFLCDLDGTINKERFCANSILAVSMTCARAGAALSSSRAAVTATIVFTRVSSSSHMAPNKLRLPMMGRSRAKSVASSPGAQPQQGFIVVEAAACCSSSQRSRGLQLATRGASATVSTSPDRARLPAQ